MIQFGSNFQHCELMDLHKAQISLGSGSEADRNDLNLK